MKTKLKLFTAAALSLSLFFTSCKKDDSTGTDNSITEMTTHSDDQARVSDDADAIANDANTIIDDYSAFSGRPGSGGTTANLLCNGTAVLDSANGLRTLTVTYNGLNCLGNRILNGVVVYSIPLGTRWRDAGAVLTVNIQNLSITRVRDNRSITMNGTKTITNVSGGLIRDLSTLGTITHDIASSGITVTFDNGSQRSWQIAKRRVFTFNNGVVITTSGTHTEGSTTNVAVWGTNRFGNAFVTAFTEPIVVRQDCAFRIVSGQVTHSRLVNNVVVTFGLDSNGNPTSCPGTGVYYMKIVWTGLNGVVRTQILPY